MMSVQEHLRRLGIGRQLKGYRCILLVVELAIQDETRLLCVRELLYQPVAMQMGCDFRCIERNIRIAIKHAWCRNPVYLAHLSGYPLTEPPTSVQFIDILTSFYLREKDRDKELSL